MAVDANRNDSARAAGLAIARACMDSRRDRGRSGAWNRWGPATTTGDDDGGGAAHVQSDGGLARCADLRARGFSGWPPNRVRRVARGRTVDLAADARHT